ncbi:MAG TPA: hypothetical protein VFK48_02160, partial [Usitatibacter sp.]|nr:hypothetical protein [Usitatibacter sp.]
RPFSAPWTIEEALEEIRSRRGTQFDPDLCDAFLQMIEELRSAHCDFDEFLSKASRKSPLLAARDRIRSIISSELAEESH